jgi:hypothetical protein
MNISDYKKFISLEIKKFINKRIEMRKAYKELIQSKKNISYLKNKYKQQFPEEHESDNGKLVIRKYKSEFSSRFKKEFSTLPSEEKRKLYELGLLRVLYKLDLSEYEKIKKENKDTKIDEFVIKREGDEQYSWTVKINEKTKKEFEELDSQLEQKLSYENMDLLQNLKSNQNLKDDLPEDVTNKLDEIERQRELNKDYIEQKIENRRQFYENLVNEELVEEMIANPSYFTDDSPYDLEETVENLEKGIVNESEMLFDEDEGK